MNEDRRDPSRCSRAHCVALLETVLAHTPGSVRGTAVFMLDIDRQHAFDAARCRAFETMLPEIGRRLAAVAPTWHRLMLGENSQFIVIAQGLVDGGAVLGCAARLVHAYDDALQSGDASFGDVSIGIAFSPQHGARADALLRAAEAGLRDSISTARLGQRSRTDGRDASNDGCCDSFGS